MKKQIPIFVAGSKSFRQQRLGLKAMANDLNAEYHDQKKDVVVQMCSYENFGDHQQEYNQFITEIAELVIFILDDGIGEHTEDEFRLAVAKYKKEDSPKILVFLKEFQEKTAGIMKIEKLLEEAFGTDFYYVAYTSTEDLCSKAKERIRQHINRYLSRRSLFRQGMWTALVTLLFVAGFTTMRYFALDKTEPDPMLVFLGGGSAANFLADSATYNYNVRSKSSKAIYVNMPSTQAYLMMSDEVFENHKNFYPICLSAKKASAIEFTENSGMGDSVEFAKKGIIIGCLLGYDTLVAHFHYFRAADVPEMVKNPTISNAELEQILLSDTTMKVFTTRAPSGTYITHNEHLHLILDSIFQKRGEIFYETYNVNRLCEAATGYKGFIVLASKAYPPNDWKDFIKNNPSTYFVRPVTTVNHDTALVKPIYVYMPANKEIDGNYTIKPVARKFLDKVLHIHFNSDTLQLIDKTFGEVVRPVEDFHTKYDK